MNARRENLGKPLDTVLTDQPPDRVAELERRMAELERDVALLKSVSEWPLFANEMSNTEKKKPGPREKIRDEDLFRHRDGLILWLEPFWPWMEDRLLAARTAGEIKALLEAVAEVPELRSDWQKRLLQNAATLLEFLWDERFRKTLPKATVTDALTLPWEDERRRRAANQLPTRKIANAMAGVPDIVWRTSLDRCSEQPAQMFIAVNLDMYYRDVFGIPAPQDQDLTGVSSPVPKPLQPISAQPSDQSATESNRAIKTTGLENENSATGHAPAR